jgi:hypothetical protein
MNLLRSGLPSFVSLPPNNLRVERPLLGAEHPFLCQVAVRATWHGTAAPEWKKAVGRSITTAPLLVLIMSVGYGEPVLEMSAGCGNHRESKELKIIEGCVIEFWGGRTNGQRSGSKGRRNAGYSQRR